MAVNKVTYGGRTIIDITGSTVTPETLAEGTVAYNAKGERIVGVMPITNVLYTAQNLTEAQKAQARQNIGVPSEDEIVQQVIDSLDTPIYGIVDDNKHITLVGNLTSGTYTLNYRDSEGKHSSIVTMTVEDSMPDSGYVELIWTDGVKLDKTTGAEGTSSGYAASGHVEIVGGYTYTAKLTMYDGSRYGGMNVLYYDASGNFISCVQLWAESSAEQSVVLTPPANATTFRLRVYYGTVYKTGMWPVYFEKTA